MGTDRELLEAAAKAAGIEVDFTVFSDGSFIWFKQGGDCFSGQWNPLTDDGDALRLAVKLELDIYYGDDEGGTSVHVGYAHDPDSDSMVRYCIEQCDTDPYAATRRAIVRAAAEIGRNMK